MAGKRYQSRFCHISLNNTEVGVVATNKKIKINHNLSMSVFIYIYQSHSVHNLSI